MAKNHRVLLIKLEACNSAVDWYNDRPSDQAWQDCPRGDWMLWIATRLGVDHKLLVAAVCDCIDTILHHVPDDELRPRQAIETVRRWIKGEASLNEVRAASDAASNAATSYAAYNAANAASYAATYNASHIASYAANPASYAANAASYIATAGDSTKAEKIMADIVRKRIPWETIRNVLDQRENQ